MTGKKQKRLDAAVEVARQWFGEAGFYEDDADLFEILYAEKKEHSAWVTVRVFVPAIDIDAELEE